MSWTAKYLASASYSCRADRRGMLFCSRSGILVYIQSSYVQKRGTQTNFIYCPAVSHRHLTLLSGRAHESVGLAQEPVPQTPEPFSSTRRHPNSRGCCHQPPCTPYEHSTGTYFRVLRGCSCCLAREIASKKMYWEQWHSAHQLDTWI